MLLKDRLMATATNTCIVYICAVYVVTSELWAHWLGFHVTVPKKLTLYYYNNNIIIIYY